MKQILVVVTVGFLLQGCAFWPTFLSFPNWGWMAQTGTDVLVTAETGKSITDHAVSAVTNKDCALIRLIKGEKVCQMTNDELASIMMKMPCNSYGFDDNSVPHCINRGTGL